MQYFAFSLFIFLFSVGIHLCVCRRDSHREFRPVLFVFLSSAGLMLYMIIAVLLLNTFSPEERNIWTYPLGVTAGFFYLLLLPTYLHFYCVTKMKSPSAYILAFIREKKEVSFAQLQTIVTDDKFIQTRIDDLVKHHFMKKEGEGLVLTPTGYLSGRWLLLYSKIFGREKGG